MTLGHRQALVELERVRASRDSLQVALDDMRRQVREMRADDVLDLRDPEREERPALLARGRREDGADPEGWGLAVTGGGVLSE